MLLAALSLLCTSTAAAELQAATSSASFAIARSRTTVYGMPGGALNPEAAVLFVGVERREVYQGEGRMLFSNLYYQYGAEVMLGALLRPAAHVELLPIRIFKLRLQYELWYWPGFALGRGHGLTFAGPDAPFGPEELKRRKGEESAGVGHRLTLMPTLQIKLWRIIALSMGEVAAYYVHGDPGVFWREPLNDTIIARGEVNAVLKNTGVLAFEVWAGEREERVLIGALHEVVYAAAARTTRHRLGGAILASPWTELWGVDRPQLFVLLGWNASDRNREGEMWMQAAVRLDHDL